MTPVVDTGEGLPVMNLSPALFAKVRTEARFQKIIREVEARREKIRKEVRQLGIDLYPPGAEPDSVG